jgi:hypothetical protein
MTRTDVYPRFCAWTVAAFSLISTAACQSSSSYDSPPTKALLRKAQDSQKWHVTEVRHVAPPAGIALDDQGDIYFTQRSATRAKKISASGNLESIGYGFSSPFGIAPYEGSTFVADTGNASVKRVLPNGNIQNVGSGWSKPSGLAVDTSGAVYVLDFGPSTVTRIKSNGKAAVIVPESACGGRMSGLSVDTSKNTYVACYANDGPVLKVSPKGKTRTVCAGSTYPLYLTNDDNGNTYVNEGGAELVECTAAGTLIHIEPDAKLGTMYGIAFGDGALYVAAGSRKLILKLTPVTSR